MSLLQDKAKKILANLEFIKAAAEGKTVQFNGGSGWEDGKYLSFDGHPEYYRIKREPIVMWAVLNERDELRYGPNRDKALIDRLAAEAGAAFKSSTYRVVELREVVKE